MRPTTCAVALLGGVLCATPAFAQTVDTKLPESPAQGEPVQPGDTFPQVSPYAVFVGGGAAELVDRRDDDTDNREGRIWAPAVARIGLAGKLHPDFTIQSEVEFNAGPYGTSVWEGQAAIQVRNQLVRYTKRGLGGETNTFSAEVGRITDPASVNYTSGHIANLLLSDTLSRFPLLTSGFNRGNGVRAAYTIADRLTLAVTANAGNPTSTTATVMVGGRFPPFARFYEVPWSAVGRDARGFPTASFNGMFLTPSALFTSGFLQVKVAGQFFTIDTNTNTQADEDITGRNLRASLRITPDEHFAAWVNASQVFNDVVDLNDSATISDDKFLGVTVGGGMDVYVKGVSGFGVQYDMVREQERDYEPITRHYLNAGVTVGLTEGIYTSARTAIFQQCQDTGTDTPCDQNGLRQFHLTMTAVLGPNPKTQP